MSEILDVEAGEEPLQPTAAGRSYEATAQEASATDRPGLYRGRVRGGS